MSPPICFLIRLLRIFHASPFIFFHCSDYYFHNNFHIWFLFLYFLYYYIIFSVSIKQKTPQNGNRKQFLFFNSISWHFCGDCVRINKRNKHEKGELLLSRRRETTTTLIVVKSSHIDFSYYFHILISPNIEIFSVIKKIYSYFIHWLDIVVYCRLR